MFIRAKIIKNKEYAYLVRNKWTSRGPRQKVTRYLGRVISPDRQKDTEYTDESTPRTIPSETIRSLIAWVLVDHGFKREGKSFILDNISVTQNGKVRIGQKKGVLHINNDYMCDFTLRKLLKFKSSKDQREVGIELAKAFISAGIPIPEDVFVQVFSSVYKEGQSYIE